MKRTFSADEIARLLRSQVNEENNYSFDFGNGVLAVQMAPKSGLVFTIGRSGEKGNPKFLNEQTTVELKELSEILWEKVAPQFLDSAEVLDDELTPSNLRDEPEDVLDPMTPDNLKEVEDPAEGLDRLVPDELRPKPDDPDLEPDPTGFIPDALREKKRPADLTLEDQLTPDMLRKYEK
jgi:hypothetical protein